MAWIRIPQMNFGFAAFFPSSKFIVATTARHTTLQKEHTEIWLEGKVEPILVGYSIDKVFSYFDKSKPRDPGA